MYSNLRELLLELDHLSTGCFCSASGTTADVVPADAAHSCGGVAVSPGTVVASLLSSQQLGVGLARFSRGSDGGRSALVRLPSREHPASAAWREGKQVVPQGFESVIAEEEGAEPDLGKPSSCPTSEQPSVNNGRRSMPLPPPPPLPSAMVLVPRVVAATFMVAAAPSFLDSVHGV